MVSLPPWMTAAVPEPSAAHREAALRRQSQLTKPPGSLGRLEDLAVTLAGLLSNDRPEVSRPAIVLFAGDHGVVAQAVSAYPAEVTAAMLANFSAGGAAISVLARHLDATLTVADVGTLAKAAPPGVIVAKARAGTRDFTMSPAMTAEELAATLEAGRDITQRALAGRDIALFGEMGIGNTTAAAALAAALIGCPAAEVTGRGTGLDEARVAAKADVIDRALRLHGLDRSGISTGMALVAVGGFEIAALAAGIVTAAGLRVPVLVDGFIVSVAALLAVRAQPDVRPWLLFSHRSAERGHARVLAELDATPILDLDLRLGEGSGAAVALPVLQAALALHGGMATFAEAGIPGPAS